ncbi:MAG: DUF4097 family beta strand repeat protein [Candidatus Marinimicrobia bacterium]|nr:DUF4097 family beta strand repeat protein [Candidatus Neomarinimicrobiota bacterium]
MNMKYLTLVIMVLSISVLMGTPPPDAEVNIDPGATYNHDITTDTGDIIVHSGARVKGVIQSTYGDIYLENDARVKKIISINGDVFLEVGSTVDQTITITYGSLRVKDNSTLNGDVITESGDIRISGSYLKKSIKTRHGDIILKNNTYVKKDIVILDRGQSPDLEPLDIYLGMGVQINGNVSAEDEDDMVVLEMFGGEVNGDVDDVEVVDSDGDDEEEDDDDEDDDEDEEDEECGGRSEWSKSVQYQTNDEVHKDGTAYKAKKNSKKKDPTSSKNSKYWIDLGDC